MDRVGLFEAKTKLSALCEQIARQREPVLITRRGRPLVRIEPVGPRAGSPSSVWAARAAWEKEHGPLREGFKLPRRARQTWRNPFED